MTKADFLQKKLAIDKIAVGYNYSSKGNDLKSGRVSYSDETSMVRIDVYLSKNTVSILSKGDEPRHLKNQTQTQIENIFKNPY